MSAHTLAAPLRIPRISDSHRPATFEVTATDETGQVRVTSIAAERPLTVYLDKRELVTLMTLGAAPEHLVLGYLRNQHLVASVDAIDSVIVDWDVHAAAVTSRSLAERDVPIWDDPQVAAHVTRKTVTSGCGQGTMFGDLLDTLVAPAPRDGLMLSDDTLYRVLEAVRRHESIYRVAGAVHGCALCSNQGDDAGRILMFVEDVGRHNAIDAIAGRMWLESMPGDDKIFYTTGRLTSEMVIKCAQIGVPYLLSRSGLTEMGHSLARRLGLTMIGRCQGRHYLLFTGEEHFVRSAAIPTRSPAGRAA